MCLCGRFPTICGHSVFSCGHFASLHVYITCLCGCFPAVCGHFASLSDCIACPRGHCARQLCGAFYRLSAHSFGFTATVATLIFWFSLYFSGNCLYPTSSKNPQYID